MLPRLALAALAATLAVPASALASTAAVEDGSVVWRGGDGAEKIYVYAPYDDPGFVRITGDGVQAGSGCEVYDNQSNGDKGARCPDKATWKLLAGGGDDEVHLLSAPSEQAPTSAASIDLGAGDDLYDPTMAAALVHGGPGNDSLDGDLYGGTSNYADELYGDDGDDFVSGGAGRDHVEGGAGNDTISGDGRSTHRESDYVDGGAGRDVVGDWVPVGVYKDERASVSLDGVANDGFPNEADDIRGVEEVQTFAATDFTGGAGAEKVAFTFQNEHLTPTKASTYRGMGGDDELLGSPAADTLDGGAGADVLDGGEGDDTIAARDGEADTVRCGPGTDKVTADAADNVAADCEVVERPATGGPPAGGGGGDAGGGGTVPSGGGQPQGSGAPQQPAGPATVAAGPATTAAASLKLAVKAPKLRAALRSGLAVTVTGAPAGKVTLRALRSGAVVATGTAKAGADGRARVVLKFSAKARRSLARARSLSLRITGGGAAASVKLRR